ncbi:hypothetical protein BJ973_003672 [Actinoplanes tereljensis]|uniref:DUF4190 domain-containing protein n=1 Tax=Paractinoplanes tereljensis TaxID=571912 RepID=A0A919NW84_9ACTN|nr:DUF4190 domain-containing protein [Actinoplanes tereljensis]GIF25395.1 hypothetical protein Ate02nite_81250 [Actinoplanes tereljensis]
MSLDSQLPPPPPPGQENYAAPAPQQQGTSGLAIAGLIFAFVFAPIGFILSLIGVFKTGEGKAKGRGLAVTGLILSSLFVIGGVVGIIIAVTAVSNSTVLDPGCTAAKDTIIKSGSAADEASLQATVDGLNAAAAKAKHDDVKAATQTLANDYKALLDAVKTGNMPAGLEDKIGTDGAAFDTLCTIGS